MYVFKRKKTTKQTKNKDPYIYKGSNISSHLFLVDNWFPVPEWYMDPGSLCIVALTSSRVLTAFTFSW